MQGGRRMRREWRRCMEPEEEDAGRTEEDEERMEEEERRGGYTELEEIRGG